ncbi:hypothetical protein CHLNCDRAFT_137905 [Chlorella variabilis]|uniref:Exonuclease domain-containing protein n=1 Tax=Chlorella variabilis TaxID=554065 RepID=E1Z4T3_CHLVA|nr:hypothetical protein CHLNCDRAFT_137905 [Chlorella variabilis]EFN59111.1 hypothetical protein CHLNCDRAFT_137905 [Chlorella variabilis]|eukprot:XP_005851213.1 hypothetical protein CHLNCDRAFT_137905 [Chlorella variabilis]
MGAHCPPPAETLSIERFAALLVVVCDGHAPLLQGMLGQPQERVRLVLLPASAHPPDYCTRHLAVQAAEGRLPRAPASLRSLQPPYVTLRHCPAARGIAAAVGWTSSHGPALVLDSETTGLSGRDYIHQLAVLNLSSCQLLTALLRTCPRTTGPAAAKASPAGAGSVCGANNQALHDPNRPTFGQLAPLLHAFIAGGGVTSGSGGHQPAPPLVVGHNAPFDARMLIAEWGRRDLPVPREWRLLDTLPLARECVPDCANHKQGTLRQRFGVTLAPGEAEHDAGSDVTVLAQLLPHLVQASGAGTLLALLEGRVLRRNGESFGRTFGDVQLKMRGAVAGGEGAAEAAAFTCGFCHSRVVE